MKLFKKILTDYLTGFFILALILSGVAFNYPALAQLSVLPTKPFVGGEVLVKFKNQPAVEKIKIDQSLDILAIVNNLKNNPEVQYVEPNYLFKFSDFPNDPLYIQQWYLKSVNTAAAWSDDLLIREQENISRKPIIAILDTGVYLNHPDLKSKIWVNTGEIAGDNIDNDKNGYVDDINGWDFVNNDKDPNPLLNSGYNFDAVNHGTAVAGIAAAATNNQEGIAGVGWFAQIMPLRILDSQGIGDVYSVVRAIDYAIAKNVDVINMSFVGSGYSFSFAEALQKVYNNNIVAVAAAGNTDPEVNGVNLTLDKFYPVCYGNNSDQNLVIGVGSVGKDLKKSVFSNYGDCIDVVAPGEDLYSTQVYNAGVSGFDQYYRGGWSGTSLSAPLVSGEAAVIKALRPNLSVKEIQNIIFKTAKNIDVYNLDYKSKLGFGYINIGQAVDSTISNKANIKLGQQNYVVAGLGVGSFPQLKILKTDGTVFKEFFPYNVNFKGVINVAVGDVNGDGRNEIITGAGEGGGPHVRVFNIEGQPIAQFFAYDKNFRGGVNIATGDINGDGIAEIITGPGKGIKPEVKIFDGQGSQLNKFLAYGDNFFGGVKVAAGDINGTGKDLIVTGPGNGGRTEVKVFDAAGTVIAKFFAFNQNFKGGINVACGDVHGDGRAEVIASIDRNAMPIVKIFSYLGTQLNSFFVFEPKVLPGVNLSVGDVNNDGINEIIVGPGLGGTANIRAFDREGNIKLDILANNLNYQGGVRPAYLRY